MSTGASPNAADTHRKVALRVAGFSAVLCLLFSACSRATLQPPLQQGMNGTVGVTVDGSLRFQTIKGLGVNANSLAWDNGTLTPALAQLTDTMGASVWRVIVESTQGWQDSADTTTYNWSYYAQLYETPKFKALWGVLGYLQRKAVPTIMLSVMGCPPAWMGDCAINVANEDYYVKMEASLLYYAQTVKHVRIDLFSPMNEEDHGAPEGPHVSASQYVRILDKLSSRLDALGLNTIQLLGPDTASVDAATADYLPALLASQRVMTKIAHFGLHDYGGNVGNSARVIEDSAYPRRDFWMTEFSAWCDGCDNGAPNPNNWDFATTTLDYLFDYIEQGASSALVYDGYDSFYIHHGQMGYWGLLAYDAATKTYTPRKRFYTVAQVVKFVRPGMVRVDAAASEGAPQILAFVDPAAGALTIVGRNPASSAEVLHGTLKHLSLSGSLALYQTTATENMVRASNIAVADGTFTAKIAPDSVFTLTSLPAGGNIGQTAPPAAVPAAQVTLGSGAAILSDSEMRPTSRVEMPHRSTTRASQRGQSAAWVSCGCASAVSDPRLTINTC